MSLDRQKLLKLIRTTQARVVFPNYEAVARVWLEHFPEDGSRLLELFGPRPVAFRRYAGTARRFLQNYDHEEGGIWYEFYSRDCDMTEVQGVSFFECPRRPSVWDQYMDDQLEWADGPMHWTILPPEEGRRLGKQRHTRDLAMEAHENGHPHVVYV